MIKTIDMLLHEYREYSNIYNKIAFEEKNNNLIKLKRGLYETNKDADPFTIANVLFSPSYISGSCPMQPSLKADSITSNCLLTVLIDFFE